MRIDSILLFEPTDVHQLYPFSIMHTAFELRCGALRLFEKVQRLFPESTIHFLGRALQLRTFYSRFPVESGEIRPSGIMVLQGNILCSRHFSEMLKASYHEFSANNDTTSPVVFTANGKRIAAYIPVEAFALEFFMPTAERLSALDGDFYVDAPEIPIKAQVINHLWDAIEWNEEAINDDAQSFIPKNSADFDRSAGIFALDSDNIILGENVSIAPCTVIDARNGAVIIGDNANIMAHSAIVGPCYIGHHSTIKIGAKIYEKTSIGEWCKIGGEVENSIIQSYSNKQHDGFLGHSYLGEWVNFGADTNTSDLKNNYSTIRVKLGHEEYNSGRIFLGILCGDHTKTSINTMFNTGTVAGISANIFGAEFPAKSIPSFSWGGRSDSPFFSIERAIVLAKTVMARRKRLLTPEEELILRKEYQMTAKP